MTQITLHRHWLDAATKGLGEALRGELSYFQDQVNQGVAQLWEIHSDHGLSWMISRVEMIDDQQELVICCYQGCDLKHIAPVIYANAVRQGFASIRFHTQRQGLNRLIIDLGFTPYETVYRKKLSQEVN